MTGGAVGGLALASSCGGDDPRIAVSGPEVRAAELRKRRPGTTIRDIGLSAGPAFIDLAGRRADTWAYNGPVPGDEVRATVGDVLRATVTNNLPDPTTVHWHGLALRNDMDGVPGLTQPAIPVGGAFTYEFTLPEPGTFWFHPHAGVQLDRGLYAPPVIEDPAEPGRYDREITLVLDDWLGDTTPEQTLQGLRQNGMQMTGPAGSMQMATSPLLGGDAGDVIYPMFLANGRPPADPAVIDVKQGERIRLRILNAGSDTAFRVALGGHQLTVTHTDGFPVQPVTVDALLIGMSERYDVTFTVSGSDVYPLVALAEGKGGQAMVVVRAGTAATPAADVHPTELDGRLLQLSALRASPQVVIPAKTPTRTHAVELGGPGSEGYHWTINGKEVDNEAEVLDKAKVLRVRQGERVRLVFTNPTTMFHPMHLHGHTFQVVAPGGAAGPRKDSLIVRPKERIAVDFDADNPGQWLIHCHNLYHQSAGMHSVLSYIR